MHKLEMQNHLDIDCFDNISGYISLLGAGVGKVWEHLTYKLLCGGRKRDCKSHTRREGRKACSLVEGVTMSQGKHSGIVFSGFVCYSLECQQG